MPTARLFQPLVATIWNLSAVISAATNRASLIGLHPIARAARHQPRRTDQALHTGLLQAPRERKASRACLSGRAHRPVEPRDEHHVLATIVTLRASVSWVRLARKMFLQGPRLD
jgi:hypothetical protein